MRASYINPRAGRVSLFMSPAAASNERTARYRHGVLEIKKRNPRNHTPGFTQHETRKKKKKKGGKAHQWATTYSVSFSSTAGTRITGRDLSVPDGPIFKMRACPPGPTGRGETLFTSVTSLRRALNLRDIDRGYQGWELGVLSV